MTELTKQTDKHSSRSGFAGKFSPEIVEVFNTFTQFKSDKEIVEQLCAAYKNNVNTDNSAVIEQLQTQLNTQKQLNADLQEINETLQHEVKELQSDLDNVGKVDTQAQDETINQLSAELEDARTANESLQEKLNTALEDANENARLLQAADLKINNPDPNTYAVKFGEVSAHIFQLNLMRIQKVRPEITASILIAELVTKYIKEQPAQIAWPFMVKKREIAEIIKQYKK